MQARLATSRHFVPVQSGFGISAAVKTAWANHRAATARRREERAIVAELSALDDATLADMGIYRGQIASIASNPSAVKRV